MTEFLDSKPVGTIIAEDFRIESFIGGGGMSIVYKCTDLRLDRLVVVKEMQPQRLGGQRAYIRFQQESKAIARLRHEGIVKLHELRLVDETPYIVMDYVEGEPLSDLIERRGKLSLDESLVFFEQIVKALVHAHENQVVHRDLKPSNIIVTPAGAIVIVDFGIAKVEMISGAKVTETGSIAGSPAYMSPEQINSKNVDDRTDQYSLGCILYECLVGHPPFPSPVAIKVMFSQLNEPPPPLVLPNNSPKWLKVRVIVDKLLQKDPANRYNSMSDLLADLAGLHRSEPGSIPSPKASLRKTTMFLAAGIVAFALAGILIVQLIQNLQSDSAAIKAADKDNATPAQTKVSLADTDKTDRSLLLNTAVALSDPIAQANHRRAIEIWLTNHLRSPFKDIVSSDPELDGCAPAQLIDLTDKDIEALVSLQNIRTLDFDACEKLTGKGFAKLQGQSVRKLRMNNCGLTDDGLKAALQSFPNLQTLEIESTRISNKGLPYVLLAPKLKALRFNDCTWLDVNLMVPLIKKLPGLYEIELKNMTLTPTLLKCLANSKLTSMNFSHSTLTDQDLKQFEHDKWLKRLAISACESLDGSGLKYLKNVPLTWLRIGPELQKNYLKAFAEEHPDCRIEFHDTSFRPANMGNMVEIFGK